MTRHPVTSSTSFLYCLGRPRVLGRQQMAGGLEGHGAQLPEKPSPGGLWGRQGPGSGPAGVGSLSVTLGVRHLWGGRGASRSVWPGGADAGNAPVAGHRPRFLRRGWTDFSPPPRTGHCQSRTLRLEWETGGHGRGLRTWGPRGRGRSLQLRVLGSLRQGGWTVTWEGCAHCSRRSLPPGAQERGTGERPPPSLAQAPTSASISMKHGHV